MEYLDKDSNPVSPELWQWVAFYTDGSILYQFDPNVEAYHYFGDIEQDKVTKFGLISPRADGVKSYIVDVPNGAKLIHYYDNIIQQPLGGETVHHRLYCFGYEINDTETEKIREKKIFTVLPSDVVITGEVENVEVL